MAKSFTARRKRQRLVVVSAAFTAVMVAALTVLFALGGDSLSLFLQPSDLAARAADGRLAAGARVKLGGLVAAGSVARGTDAAVTLFTVTDCATDVRVSYRGLLPDLFKEGQGVVTEGVWQGHAGAVLMFEADTVLAKHDENYAPPGTEPDNPDACTHPGQVRRASEPESAAS